MKRLIEDEKINLSKWLNENVPYLLSVETAKDVQDKIDELKTRTRMLMKRKQDLEQRKSRDEKEYGRTRIILEDFRRAYVLRRNQKLDLNLDLSWIASPKNVKRCSELGRDPENVLDGLKEWYDGVQKSNE